MSPPHSPFPVLDKHPQTYYCRYLGYTLTTIHHLDIGRQKYSRRMTTPVVRCERVRGMKVIAGKEVLTSLEEIIDPKRAALLVVDLQNDFCSPDGVWGQRGYDVSGMPAVIANSKRLIESARAAGVQIIYIQMTKLPGYKSVSPPYLRFMVDKNDLSEDEPGCAPGTWGADVLPEIAPQPGDLVVQKWRSSAFVGTPLELILRSNAIQSVVVCGVATNACVESTVRDAFNNNYYVVLAEDCVAAYEQRLHDASLTVLRGRVDVIPSDRIIMAWSERDNQPGSGIAASTVSV